MAYLDRVLLEVIDSAPLGTVAEICCGRGEAVHLLGDRIARGIGIDISLAMLEVAVREFSGQNMSFVQGDATMLPLAGRTRSIACSCWAESITSTIANACSREVARILKPGGRFYFREPISDFALWRWIRVVIYRLAPALDYETEKPLRREETVPVLEKVGLRASHWSTHGFLGFCLLMNSDVLVFNRLFRFCRVSARSPARRPASTS